MESKKPTTSVVTHARMLLTLIPPNLRLSAEEMEDLEGMVGAALSRVRAIRAGLYTAENRLRPPTDEQLKAAVEANYKPPTPEQIAEMERFRKGPTRSDRRHYAELMKRRERLEKTLQGVEAQLREISPLVNEDAERADRERYKFSAIDDVVLRMAKRGLTPGDISRSLQKKFLPAPRSAGVGAGSSGLVSQFVGLDDFDAADRISPESLSEKAINARLFRLRARGFEQPVSPTAKKRRTKT